MQSASLLSPSSIKQVDLVSAPDTTEIYGTMSGNERKVSCIISHASDFRFTVWETNRQHDDNTPREPRSTTTSEGLAHAHPIKAGSDWATRSYSQEERQKRSLHVQLSMKLLGPHSRD